MLLTETPFGFADQAALLPAVTLACVYFWSLFRPAAMPPPVVFLIGLLFDLLGYLPLGVGAADAADRARPGAALAAVADAAGFPGGLAGVRAASPPARRRSSWAADRAADVPPAAAGPRRCSRRVLTAALYPALAMLFIRAHRTRRRSGARMRCGAKPAAPACSPAARC